MRRCGKDFAAHQSMYGDTLDETNLTQDYIVIDNELRDVINTLLERIVQLKDSL